MVTLAVSKIQPGGWAHSPLGQGSTTAVQQGGPDRHTYKQRNSRRSSSLGPLLWVLVWCQASEPPQPESLARTMRLNEARIKGGESVVEGWAEQVIGVG